MAFHEALYARLSGRRSEEADCATGTGGRRVFRISAGAFAIRAAARPDRVQAGIRARSAAKAVHQPGRCLPTAACTTISAWRPRGSVTRPSLSATAAARSQAEEEPKTDWARHSYRVLNLIDNQVRSLRKRQVIESFKSERAQGRLLGHPHQHRGLSAERSAGLSVRADACARRDADAAEAHGRRSAGAADQLGLCGLRRRVAKACGSSAEAGDGLSLSRWRSLS